jgi:lysophospholipase L1-like esterase
VENDDLRICYIGDSFVHGTNDPLCLGWTGRLSAEARRRGYALTSYNLGVRRDTSRDIARRWLMEVACRLPVHCKPYVVFSFGVNDTTLEDGRLRVAAHESVKITRQLLKIAKSRYSVLMVGPPPIADGEQNRRTELLSRHLCEVAGQENVPFLEVFHALFRDEVWMAEVRADDGAHPRASGYECFAKLVDGWSEWWFKQPIK